MHVNVPVTSQFQIAIKNAIRIGAASQHFRQILQRSHKKAQQRRFELWKFLYLGNREGFRVITQTKHMELQYSDTSLS